MNKKLTPERNHVEESEVENQVHFDKSILLCLNCSTHEGAGTFHYLMYMFAWANKW